MNFNDHSPPHFHARYGKERALIGISPLVLLEGNLSPRVLGLVMEWGALHRDELLENWNLARNMQLLNSIEPLR